MRDTEKAFHWIINILKKHGIEYKISGGFAALAYGVDRELADIDIEMADTDILKVAEDAKSYIIFGPARYKDEKWDLQLMTLNYEGQEIDIASTNAKIFNQATRQWEEIPSDLKNYELKEAFGMNVPVETLDSLITYKLKLAREVDVEDVRQLQKIASRQ